ncbi:MAG: hypothetical protein ABIN18_09150 [Pseudomonadota bacterium]
MTKLIKVLCLFAFFVSVISLTHAQNSSQQYRINYDKGLLSLSAKKANLEMLLTDLSKKTGIPFRFPRNLKNQITIRLSNVPLRKGLRRLLKDQNYALIYKGSAISEVYIVPKSRGRSISRNYKRSRVQEERIRASLKRYEKRLETLKDRMTAVNEDSRRGRIIMKQIHSTEKIVERLHKRLE